MLIDSSTYCLIKPKANEIGFFEKFVCSHDSVPPTEKINLHIKPVFSESQKTFIQSLFTGHQLKVKTISPALIHKTNEDWMAAILLFSALLFTYIRFGFQKRLQQIFRSFLSDQYINQLNREGNLFAERISFPLFINYLVIFPLFFYLINKTLFNFLQQNTGWEIYIKILLITLLIYVGKIFFIRIIGFIFNTVKEATDHLLIIFIFNQMIGLILLPFLVFIAYSGLSVWFAYMLIVLILLIYIYRIIRIALFGLANSKFSKFYLFLYLCTIEFLPLIILAKILSINH